MCNALCDMPQEAIESSHLYEEESSVSQIIKDESNHYDVEQELLLEQERFGWTEIISGQVGRQVGRPVGRWNSCSHKKSCNSTWLDFYIAPIDLFLKPLLLQGWFWVCYISWKP